MNRIFPFIGVVFLGFLFSCKQDKPTPKVIYEETPKAKVVEEKVIDTSSIKIADLPILIEGTKYLLHPVGDIRVYDNSRSSYGSSKVNQVSYSISNYDPFEVTGYFDNIKFQHIDSTSIYSLTDKKMQIQSVTYLKEIADKSTQKILVYSVVDSDTNRDGKVNQSDIKSLYLSFIDGSNFTKISDNFNEVIDWHLVAPLNRLYFRCIEDINKNGAFDKNDKVHYHFLNLNSSDWQPVEYQPI